MSTSKKAVAAGTSLNSTTKSNSMKNFVREALKDIEKSEKQLKVEALEDFAETAAIAAETQISLIERSNIPTLEHELKKARLELEKAQKAFEKSRFTAPSNNSFETYIERRNQAKEDVVRAESKIGSIESQIEKQQRILAEYKAVLADFS